MTLAPLEEELRREGQAIAGKRKTTKPSRERWTIYVLHSLAEELRDAAYWTPGATLSGMIEEGMQDYLTKLRRKYTNGEPFKARTGKLPLGRPRK